MRALLYPKDIVRLFYYLAIRALFYVTPFSLIVRFGYVKGAYRYHTDKRLRNIVLKNLTRVYGGRKSREDILALTKSVIQSYTVIGLCHSYFGQKLSEKKIEEIFPLRGLENLDEALKKGKGAILLAGHLGVMMIVWHLIYGKGYPLRAVRFKGTKAVEGIPRRERRSRLGEFIESTLRVRKYQEPEDSYFQVNFNSRPLIEHLGRNGVLLILADGVHSISYLRYRFLRNDVPFAAGAMSLARQSGAEVLPITVEGKVGSRAYRTAVGSPFPLQASASRKDDIRANTLKFVKCLEKQITRHPYLWRYWVYEDYFLRKNEFYEKEPDRHAAVFGIGKA
jgi:lauroyl/myristoyl acyltransferase